MTPLMIQSLTIVTIQKNILCFVLFCRSKTQNTTSLGHTNWFLCSVSNHSFRLIQFNSVPFNSIQSVVMPIVFMGRMICAVWVSVPVIRDSRYPIKSIHTKNGVGGRARCDTTVESLNADECICTVVDECTWIPPVYLLHSITTLTTTTQQPLLLHNYYDNYYYEGNYSDPSDYCSVHEGSFKVKSDNSACCF